jgi:hypothetical protein
MGNQVQIRVNQEIREYKVFKADPADNPKALQKETQGVPLLRKVLQKVLAQVQAMANLAEVQAGANQDEYFVAIALWQ